MVDELKDPEFTFTTRMVSGRCTWAVAKPSAAGGPVTMTLTTTKKDRVDKKKDVTTVKTESVSVEVAGFVHFVWEKMGALKRDAKDPTDAVKAGTHAYLQAVLNNLKNELKDATGAKRARPVTIKNSAIRVAGGWGHDPHDRCAFEEACETAGCEAYSQSQFGECTGACRFVSIADKDQLLRWRILVVGFALKKHSCLGPKV